MNLWKKGDPDPYEGVAFGRRLTEPERPLALVESQQLADDGKLAVARGWWREVPYGELEHRGSLGRRFIHEGRAYRIEEAYGVYLDPASSAVEMFTIDPAGRLILLKPEPPTNRAVGLTPAVISGRVEGGFLITQHGTRRL